MKNMEKQLKKYAELVVKTGTNVQKGEDVFITSPTDSAPFTRIVAEECYKAGARKVTINWIDEKISRIKYLNETKETLADIYDWQVKRSEEIVDRKAVMIHIASEDPKIFEGVSPDLISAYIKANAEKCKKYQDSTMSGNTRWTIAAYPSPEWAKIVFPELSKAQAVKKLWELIAKAVRLDKKDTLAEWAKHQQKLAARVKILNESKIKFLRYKNSLGTDLRIGLVNNYMFEGGATQGGGGVFYTANIPTEEVFTAPSKTSAEGKVVASMPLIYNGNKIDGFWLEFKKGRVVNYFAKTGLEFLKELIETDEGSHYLGEVALVGYNSPIQNLKTLFYNTLFDENASCHLALGRAYPSCVKGGSEMDREAQLAAGLNFSFEHEDFMIGTADLSIIAECEGGKEMVIFKNGDWVF